MPPTDRTAWICLPIATELGEFVAGYSDRGLAELHFPSEKREPAARPSTTISSQIQQWHRRTSDAVKKTLAGRPPKHLPPFDLSRGTEFQQSVWQAMTNIQLGQTLSYGEIAREIGKPKAMRAVGGACGANPIPVLVPCHRVLAANQKIGGFSGGLDWKRELLMREGVTVIG
jgi:O-6-methylguanine DNA methyltransferase